MKRLFWVAVGAASTVATLRKAREVTDKHVPAGARSALGAAAGVTTLVQRAVAEFRTATAEREAELRADLLAGADLPRARARVDAWRAQRADDGGSTAPGTARPGSAAGTAAASTGTSSATREPRAGGAHRAEDPDDGDLGYSFY